jgi:hypothetical protein
LLLKARPGNLHQGLGWHFAADSLQKQQTGRGVPPKALRSAGSRLEIKLATALFSSE